jgi:peptide/nickel transport system substrate-binding protein
MRLKTFGFIAAAAAIAATPAFAQKSKETVRIAVNNPFSVLSNYHLPLDEAAVVYKKIYEPLIGFDEYKQKWVPRLSSSWKTVSPGVYEFDLRQDLKFHNGNTFDADDVVKTLTYIADPTVKLTFKHRYSWMKSVEKLSSHKVRIVADEARTDQLELLAFRINIWDAETMSKLNEIEDYGRVSPVGTGIYKAVQVDRNAGTIIERYDGFKTDPEEKAPSRRVHAIPMPDRQTQVAQLMTGGIDMLRGISPDTAKELERNPKINITNIASPSTFYMMLDSAGVSGNKALSDKRVRRAIFMAIDRDTLIKHLVPGSEVATKLEALCYKTTLDCKYNVKAPDYDPAGAKKLLAEAGYANGFEFEYNVFSPYLQLGEAIAGDLRKIGIIAKIQSVDISLYRRKQGQGQLQGLSVLSPSATHPAASNILNILFEGPAFQYYNDSIISEAMADAGREFDDAKRADLYAKVFDRTNSESYIFPVTSIPTVYAHSSEIEILPDRYAAGDVWASSYAWK